MVHTLAYSEDWSGDPQLRYTDNQGTPFVNVGVACNTYRGPDQDTIVHFFDATLWRHQAESIANNCQKGDEIYIQGALQVREYTRQDGSQGTSQQINVKEFRHFSSRRSTAPDEPQKAEPSTSSASGTEEEKTTENQTDEEMMAQIGDPINDPFA